MPTYGPRSRGNLETCDPRLQALFNEVIKTFDNSIICGQRGEEEQMAAFNAIPQRSKARFGESPHNVEPLSKAVDAVPWPVDWEDIERMAYFAGFVMCTAKWMEIPIRWGNDWDGDTDLRDNKLNDRPHFELLNWRE